MKFEWAPQYRIQQAVDRCILSNIYSGLFFCLRIGRTLNTTLTLREIFGIHQSTERLQEKPQTRPQS